MKNARVLFLGEGELTGSARYLAAVLTWGGIPFDHVQNTQAIPAAFQKRAYSAFLLSDYAYRSFSAASRRWLCRSVESGAGLLMIGGWASFTGLSGGYAGTPIERL